MNLKKYKLYLVLGGVVLDAIYKHIEVRWQAQDAILEFQNKYEADSSYITGGLNHSYCCGLMFEGEAPEGWKKLKDGSAIPVKQSIKDEMRSLPPIPGYVEFGKQIGQTMVVLGNRIFKPHYEQFGDSYVLLIPFVPGEACPPVPGEVREIDSGEYYAMKQAAECAA